MLDNELKHTAESEWLDKQLMQVWDRLLNATDDLQLEKAKSLMSFLQWRYEELRK